MKDRTIEISELPEALEEFVRECEITGRKTWFTRQAKRVAVIVSHDEYLALRESIEIAADDDQREAIREAERNVERNEILLPEDLLDT